LKTTIFNRATHFSIIWGVCLAVITVLEWNSLDRNPVKQEILSPFIQRTMTVEVAEAPGLDTDDFATQQVEPNAVLNYQVSFHFNGPLFIAVFFVPILIFHCLAALWNRLRRK
tara:strand:+ start:40865 stop:41203 length:339 start_codon:yes stop_codon:yes gene_type:complete